MPERRPELFEIGVRQFGEDFGVNFVFAKCGLVLPKPEAPQPVAHVHHRVPGGFVLIISEIGQAVHGGPGRKSDRPGLGIYNIIS